MPKLTRISFDPHNARREAARRLLLAEPRRAGRNYVPALVAPLALLMTAPLSASLTAPSANLPPVGHATAITLDSGGDKIIPRAARVEQLGGGFNWVEGPLWVPKGQFLLFSDVPKNRIYRWSRGRGTRLFLEPSGGEGELRGFREPGSNGLKAARPGFLVMADQGNRGIAQLNLTTKRKRGIVDRFEGKRFNSPNDLIVGPGGAIWFTDPPYGLEGIDDSPLKEQAANGVYRLAPGGHVTLVEANLRFPNGIAFSPDGRTLYVSNSDPKRAVILAYDVARSGDLSNRRVFADMTPLADKLPGLPDGMVVDERGDVFATGPGGVHIFSPAGRELGRISTDAAISNCTFGGVDGRTLFMTSSTAVYAVRTSVRGTPARLPAIFSRAREVVRP
jgi:gluconolactonase